MFTWFWQPPDHSSRENMSWCWQLPSEVWLQVFGYLSHRDRLRVRAVSKGFRDIVDNSRLWRDWTLTLRKKYVSYNKQFWRTLRRWRVSSAALLSCPLTWRRISTELPHLHTLITDDDSRAALESMRCFSNMKRLYLRRSKGMSLHNLLVLLPPQLTHLSVCDIFHSKRKPVASFTSDLNFNTAAHLKNLTSLVLHTTLRMEPKDLLPTVLSTFPHLTHLSVLSPMLWGGPYENVSKRQSLQHRSLTSLEIIDGINDLSDDMMKMMPSLRNLALFFIEHLTASERSPVSVWLNDLPALSSLRVVEGPPVHKFVTSIPSSVTRLSLLPARITPAEMAALSSQLPNLQHLHLEPAAFLGSDTALIPQLFPGLRSLHIRHERTPEEAFLSLAALTQLRRLETQDSVPPSARLIFQLRVLTQNRVQIFSRPEGNPLWNDDCINSLPTVK